MTELIQMGKRAKKAAYELALLDSDTKNRALNAAADALEAQAGYILSENEKDMEAGRQNGMSAGLLDRLMLSCDRISAMAQGLRQVAKLPDPVGEVIESFVRPNGIEITKKRVPLGVIGIIYESRPNVTADAFGLCFKSGNAVMLKGGSDALCSNIAIETVLRGALEQQGICTDAVMLLHSSDRAAAQEMMRLNGYLDVLIPRGGAGLIRTVVENSTVPVIETGTGNCHIYVDEDADIDKAIPIILNAKTQRVGVCNACESLVVHEKICESLLPRLYRELLDKNVEIRADERSFLPLEGCVAAQEKDFETEYLSLVLSVKTVDSLKEAIAHINRCGTGHSEAIITENKKHAESFLNGIDAACVYVNASTRFTDGFEFGFGAEIGISTQKLHARGPMGLKELTSYKYTICGNGQTRG